MSESILKTELNTSTIVDNSPIEKKNTGEISAESKLQGEVKHASKGAAGFFYHPATIAIFSILTVGLYGIGIAIHALATSGSKDSSAVQAKAALDTAKAENHDTIKKIPVKQLAPESTELPKITSKKDLIAYIKLCCDPKHTVNGKSVEDGSAVDFEGKTAKIFKFKGIVFRGDGRQPKEILKVGGFMSKNDLTIPHNMQEAQGIGETKGATGTSGVSCANTIPGVAGYVFPSFPNENQDSGRLYIIDTTKIDEEDEPFYMTDNIIKNGYNEKDTSGGEVNITRVPSKAIVGWIKFDYYSPNDNHPGDPKGQLEALSYWLEPDSSRHDLVHVEFNSRYKP